MQRSSLARTVCETISRYTPGPSLLSRPGCRSQELVRFASTSTLNPRRGSLRPCKVAPSGACKIIDRAALEPIHNAVRPYRGFVTASKTRSQDDGKDKSPSREGTKAFKDDGLGFRDDSIAASSSAKSRSEHAKSSSASSSTMDSDTAEHTATSSTAEAGALSSDPDASPDKPDRRAASDADSNTWSRLSSFDGLTSSSSLSTLLTTLSTRAGELSTSLRSRLSLLSTQYNTHTGYTLIESLKARIVTLESDLNTKRELAVSAKKAYLSSVSNRSSSQRETNDLLSRKNSWSESDLGRYTELLRKEHALSREEAEREKELERTEGEVQGAFDELMRAVMVRYHEEQIWSDKMRSMSTYGSLFVAGLNAFLFILAILLVEPYKRKKLAQTFESRLVSAEEQSREMILASVDKFEQQLSAALAVDQPVSAPIRDEAEVITPPPLAVEHEAEIAQAALRRKREQEERLIFASTVGVVVGAALSLTLGACWS